MGPASGFMTLASTGAKNAENVFIFLSPLMRFAFIRTNSNC
jgi:hypothetical protein